MIKTVANVDGQDFIVSAVVDKDPEQNEFLIIKVPVETNLSDRLAYLEYGDDTYQSVMNEHDLIIKANSRFEIIAKDGLVINIYTNERAFELNMNTLEMNEISRYKYLFFDENPRGTGNSIVYDLIKQKYLILTDGDICLTKNQGDLVSVDREQLREALLPLRYRLGAK